MSDRSAAQTSIYLNTEDWEVLTRLQERTGLGRSAVVRLALHNADQTTNEIAQIERLAKIRVAAEQIIALAQGS